MCERKIETTTGMCVVALTKHIMKNKCWSMRLLIKAFDYGMYHLLQDSETRLFLEPNEYLVRAYDIESKEGKDALYQYIAQ